MEDIRILTDEELKTAYETTMREAFPPEELKPLSAIRKMQRDGIYAPYGLFIDGAPAGYIFFWLDLPYILIDYLCVPKEMRGGGIGARLLGRAMALYPEDTVFIGEVEAPGVEPELDAIRLRRLAFYDRCGALAAGYDCAAFGVHYKTVVWAKKLPELSELQKRHDGFYRRRFSPEKYAAAIQIPLREGEQVKPFAPWTE